MEKIEIAQQYEKAIIAIEIWDSDRTSTKVRESADRIVKCQSKSIADAIEELG